MLSVHEIKENLINENLNDVLQLYVQYLKDDKFPCKCRECLLDIVAITLNSLKPRYSVSLLGEFYKSNEAIENIKKEVEDAMNKAIEIVKKRPHHC